MMFRLALGLATVAVVAGCSLDPKDYETTPVVVDSAAGPVTCQLYTHEQVTWDRSTNRPASMSVTTADNICRQEGYRVMRGGAAEPAATVAVTDGATVVVAPQL